MTSLTPAGVFLADEIARNGPIRFSRFMEVALYHPEFGYYYGERSRPGKEGDFYTAEQLQPVYGRLIARYIRMLTRELGLSHQLTVVEIGAGHEPQMAQAFSEFHYIPVDLRYGMIPERFTGVIFTNEFFDSVPVDVVKRHEDVLHEMRVEFGQEGFRWTERQEAVTAVPNPLPAMEDGQLAELQHHRIKWLREISDRLGSGFIITVDYGFTQNELVRFPQGTLMSYRRHRALDDVLGEPGTRDITAHVSFSDLKEYGESLGLATVRLESLASALLHAGEPDQFESALAGDSEKQELQHRLQLKLLLFGMGETFRVLVQRKESKKNGLDLSRP